MSAAYTARKHAVSGLTKSTRPEPRMSVEDVARAVVHMASLPPDANVASMTVLATTMPYVGRG